VKIVIETIPHDKHRYPTIGDWWTDAEGTRQIRVSELSDFRYALLVAVHELVEQALCQARGISEQQVTNFDKDHLELDEPGESPRAPYHREHVTAENIERLLAQELDVNWQRYTAACLALDAEPAP
jgi:hypothetical protein